MFSTARRVASVAAAAAAPLRGARAISAAATVRAAAVAITQAASSSSQQQQARSSTRSRLMIGGAAALLAAAAFSTVSGAEAAPAAAKPADQKAYAALQFEALPLVRREKYNYNTDLFTFALPDPSVSLDLPVSSYIMTRCPGADGKPVVRPYTPINQSERGVMTLLVKRYDAGVMSKHMHNMKVGDTLEIKGPLPKLRYEANKYSAIGMVAGGTGITPCLQVLDEIANNPNDHTKVSVVFANVSPKDILLKERLDALSKKNKNIRVTYTVDSTGGDASWKGPVGFLTPALLSSLLPKPDAKNFVYVCGPPPMMNAISGNKNMKDYSQGELSGALKELGYSASNVFKF